MATIKQVAALANLSVSCVSKYLKNPQSVRSVSRESIESAIKELNYVPSSIARSLRTKKTGCIQVMLHSITNPFFAELYECLRIIIEENGLHTIIRVLDSMDDPVFSVNDFANCDGMILCFLENDNIYRSLSKAAPKDFPIVSIHSHKPEETMTSVTSDIKNGMKLVTDYLISLGCKNLAYIGGPGQSSVSIMKFNGFSEAIANSPENIFCTAVIRGTYDLKSGYNDAKELLETHDTPDAIICENDNLAAGALHCLMEMGIEVPNRVHVTGFDNIPLAEMIYPPLTSIDLRLEDLSKAACKEMLALLKNEKSSDQHLAPRLVIRQS